MRRNACDDPGRAAPRAMSGWACFLAAGLLLALVPASGAAQDPEPETPERTAPNTAAPAAVTPPAAPPPAAAADESPPLPAELVAPEGALPDGMIPLAKEGKVWIDLKRKLLVVDGNVCLRRGTLEMFACPRGSKEHESIVAVHAPASVIHAGLLAIGAKPGTPVRFRPEYRPPTGSVIDVWVVWRDGQGNRQQVRAQEWIRNVRTGQAMAHAWVFAGSSFWVDEQTGQRRYNGDAGDFICVSNFPTATLDIPVESSDADEQLLFEAFTEHIPELDTKLRLILAPRRTPEVQPAANGLPDESTEKPEQQKPEGPQPGAESPASEPEARERPAPAPASENPPQEPAR